MCPKRHDLISLLTAAVFPCITRVTRASSTVLVTEPWVTEQPRGGHASCARGWAVVATVTDAEDDDGDDEGLVLRKVLLVI